MMNTFSHEIFFLIKNKAQGSLLEASSSFSCREGAVLNTFNQYHIFHISFEASTSFSFSCGEGAMLHIFNQLHNFHI